MRQVFAAVALALLFISGSQANAATTRFDFFWTPGNGSWQSELNYSKDGIDLKVTEEGGGKVRHWYLHGLGAWGGPGDGSHQIDSWGYKEVVGFTFNKMVKIVGIGFSYVDWYDTYDLYVGSTANQVVNSGALPNNFYAYVPIAGELVSNFFGVGAGWDGYCDWSKFKIKYVDVMEVSAIPLPAGGWLLIGGLGGLAALRRRKYA